MAITTTEAEYKRLRSYLTPYIRGKNVDAILESLATGSAHLVNNVAAVNDQMYIATASEQYLDERLADFGITRPSAAGISDDVFRQIGIQVKNRKQVRDLMDKVLVAVFGDELTKANARTSTFEPYNLFTSYNLMDLIVSFDGGRDVTITFPSSDFSSIAAATAQEVADSISKSFRIQGVSASAIAENDGDGAYVRLISDTVGPASSITIRGGLSQTQFKFDSLVQAIGGADTTYNVTPVGNGNAKFTWTSGTNPNLDRVSVGDYAVFSGGFLASPNQGSYVVTKVVGGSVGVAYFQVDNPNGSYASVAQGTSDGVLFFTPIKNSLSSKKNYAAVYQAETNVLQIFMPPATKVIRNSRIGTAHLHDQPAESYSISANLTPGDTFNLTPTSTLVAETDFAIGSSAETTAANLVAKINTISNLKAIKTHAAGNKIIVTVFQMDPSVTLLGTYSGSVAVTALGIVGDSKSVQTDQPGPYIYDLTQPFTVSSVGTTLLAQVDYQSGQLLSIKDGVNFPNAEGLILFEYGSDNQEGPVPYISRPSAVPGNSTLLLDPAYTVKNFHPVGSDVALIANKNRVAPSVDGSDYAFYITDTVAGRVFAQDVVTGAAAAGLKIIFTILYPSDIGLGKWGTAYTENPTIWGD